MTETEKRRSSLLEQTRKIYSDQYTPPAIHPRFKGAYQSIYKNENMVKREGVKSTFSIRMVIAVLLFGLFAMASYNEVRGTEKVVAEIQRELVGLVDLSLFR